MFKSFSGTFDGPAALIYIFMSQPTPPRPRKRPSQSRSMLLVEAIQQACLRILEQEGPDQLTTQRIADVAGVNIASLYQYFPNKEAVLAEVFEEQVRNYAALARARFADIDRLSRVSLENTLRAIVDMEIEQRQLLLRMEPAFYRTYQHSFDIHRRVNEMTQSMDNPGWQQWFPTFLSRHRHRLRSDDFGLLSRIALHALSGTLQEMVAEDPQCLGEATTREELLTLLLNYLCHTPP